LSYVLRTFDSPAAQLDGRTILVTGGTGSFGRAFIEHVVRHHRPAKLIVFSRDELKQYEMAQQFPEARYPCIRYFIGDVRDCDRLEMAMRGVDIVIHAAALKHVPAAEYNPFECIHTNVLGAENIVKAALRMGVKSVLALSTDKAVNPANLYGASKLASDKIFVAANRLAGADGTRFAIVRYGNVVGSRGSVVPFFRKLIADGADRLPITDARMTRFWITLDQSVRFVLSSLTLMGAGEIFVPRIPSMKVVDIARVMAPNLKQELVGIRPGEKLHEALITEDDASTTFELEDRFVIAPRFFAWHERWQRYKNSCVAEGFHYTSDNNTEWLDDNTMRTMLT
jgi:UDP-N-acetylglucosamine 4,6-dehydratase/5-epimerase